MKIKKEHLIYGAIAAVVAVVLFYPKKKKSVMTAKKPLPPSANAGTNTTPTPEVTASADGQPTVETPIAKQGFSGVIKPISADGNTDKDMLFGKNAPTLHSIDAGGTADNNFGTYTPDEDKKPNDGDDIDGTPDVDDNSDMSEQVDAAQDSPMDSLTDLPNDNSGSGTPNVGSGGGDSSGNSAYSPYAYPPYAYPPVVATTTTPLNVTKTITNTGGSATLTGLGNVIKGGTNTGKLPAVQKTMANTANAGISNRPKSGGASSARPRFRADGEKDKFAGVEAVDIFDMSQNDFK